MRFKGANKELFKKRDYLVDPHILKELKGMYCDLRENTNFKSFCYRGILLLKIVGTANLLVQHLSGITDDIPSRSLFKSVLGSFHKSWQLPGTASRMINKSTESKTYKPPQMLDFNALIDLHVVTEILFGLDEVTWIKAQNNLKILRNTLLELLLHSQLLVYWKRQSRIPDIPFDRFGCPMIPEIPIPDSDLPDPEIPKPPDIFDRFEWREYVVHFNRFREFQELTEHLHDGVRFRCFQEGYFSNFSIEPRFACAGTYIALLGDFSDLNLAEWVVFFPTTWGENGYTSMPIDPNRSSETRIEVAVPYGATHGCLWLYNSIKDREYVNCLSKPKYLSYPNDLTNIGYDRVNSFTKRRSPEFPSLPPKFCRNSSIFEGSLTSIENFTIDGIPNKYEVCTRGTYDCHDQYDVIYVWSGQPVHIAFKVYAASELNISISIFFALPNSDISTYNSYSQSLLPTSTTYPYTPLDYSTIANIELTLTAKNDCLPQNVNGEFDEELSSFFQDPENFSWDEFDANRPDPITVSDKAILRVRHPPNIQILAIEVTQCIQEMDALNLTNSANNSVDLIHGRTTIIRVYVDSGLRYTTGNNDVKIDGSLTLRGTTSSPVPLHRLEGYSDVYAKNFSSSSVNSVRATFENSVTFLLPPWSENLYVDQDYEVSVFVPGYSDQPGWSDTVSFSQRYDSVTNPRPIKVYIIDDDVNNLKVGSSPLQNILKDLKRFLPIVDDWDDIEILQFWMIIGSDLDLKNEDNWGELLDYFKTFAEDYPNGKRYTWIGVVPRSNDYGNGGIAKRRESDDSNYRVCLVQDGKFGTTAHEFCHTLGIHHANCCEYDCCDDDCADQFEETDDNLPSNGRRSNVGVNIFNPVDLYGAGGGDLMSYCYNRWTSTELWEYVKLLIGRS